jgi:hypothetical protein
LGYTRYVNHITGVTTRLVRSSYMVRDEEFIQ